MSCGAPSRRRVVARTLNPLRRDGRQKLLGLVGVIEARHAGLPLPAATRKVTLPDPLRHAVFVALCKRDGLDLHQHVREQQPRTMGVCVPPLFFGCALRRGFEGTRCSTPIQKSCSRGGRGGSGLRRSRGDALPRPPA